MKYFIGIIGAFIFVGIMVMTQAQNLMFNTTPSPYGVEETAARIQRNIQRLEGARLETFRLKKPCESRCIGWW